MALASPFSPFKDTGTVHSRELPKSLMPISRICLVGNLAGDEELIKIAEKLKLPVEFSETGDEWSFTKDTLFVVEDFTNLFERFQSHHRILGPVALIQIQEKFGKIPSKLTQPFYTLMLYKKKICLYGFEKTSMTELKNLINFMGGSVRPVVKDDISYLVTNSAENEQYEKALKLNIPAVLDKWIFELWNKRHNIDCCLDDDSLQKLRVSELSGLKIALFGYADKEKEELEEVILGLGSSNVDPWDQKCTHLVVNDDPKADVRNLPVFQPNCKVVTPEWLALCVRMGIPALAEHYVYKPATPGNQKGGKTLLFNTLKRKHDASNTFSPEKSSPRSCPFSEGKKAKTPRKFDIKTNSAVKPNASTSENIPPEKQQKILLRRRYKCEELCQTEKNYLSILNGVIELFKVPLENCLKENKAILNERDIKTIFHRFLPIVEVHKKILAALEHLISQWQDNASVGQVFVGYSDEIIKVYPQYINHLDMIKDLIEEKAASSPEFHKFLKEAESNAVCMRQELTDLIAWPMQRLGRVILLLQGILDDTPLEHKDYKPLKIAIEAMEKCGRQVNQDKRVTENAINRIELFYDIENCPPEVLSLSEAGYFVQKLLVQEVYEKDGVLRRAEHTLCLILFQKKIEICKQRNNTFHLGQSSQKRYKHISLHGMNIVQHVIAVSDCKNKFCLVYQPPNQCPWRNIYTILDEDIKPETLVQKLAQFVAHSKMGSMDDILKNMTLEEVVNYFKDTVPSASTSSWFSGDTTPDNRMLSPKKQTSIYKGMRRAMSAIFTPIQNLSSNMPSMKAMGSATNVGLFSPEDVQETPTCRRKKKSQSFQSKLDTKRW